VSLYHLDMDARTACLIAVMAVSQVAGQQRSAPLRPPFGPANHLVSPDGAYALFGSDNASQLWLEDTRTHQRRMVFEVTVRTLTLAWSPDSAAFIANDRAVSDLEIAYIYDVKTLDRLDLRSRILAADAEAARFVPGPNTAPHSYFHAIRWLNARQVEVQLHGHIDGARSGKSVPPGVCFDTRNGTVLPGKCFDLCYRVSRDGAVQKLSQRVLALTSKACDGME
jgi:hypothetical protein